jgi:GT2 family glycosyltransferase
MLVDIVIVNWNAGPQLQACIDSIAAYAAPSVASVTIVDNGSVDGSERVDPKGLPLEVVRTGANLGFARACNIGAARSRAPFVLLLNPDTRLLEHGLEPALAGLGRPEGRNIGVLGIRLIGEDGSTQKHVARTPTTRLFLGEATGLSRVAPGLFPPLFLEEFDHLSSRDVDHVIGAFYLVRREIWAQLGGLDERYFIYLEDLDFSVRCRAQGFRVHYLADMVAFHRGGGTSEQVKAARVAYALESRLVYAAIHLPWAGVALVSFATLCIEPFVRLAFQAAKGSADGMRETLRAYRMLWPAALRRAFGRGPAAITRAGKPPAAR